MSCSLSLQEELATFLADIDRDGSGTIEWGEFLELMVGQLRGSTARDTEDGIRNAFNALDHDHDGFITLSEFKQLMTRWHQSQASKSNT